MHERCFLIVSLAITEAVALYVHIFLTGCGWSNSSNVFCKNMTSLPVTKKPPVSYSDAEAATSFKMLQFKCTGGFSRYRGNVEGILPNKKYATSILCDCGLVRYDASVSVRKIMSAA